MDLQVVDVALISGCIIFVVSCMAVDCGMVDGGLCKWWKVLF